MEGMSYTKITLRIGTENFRILKEAGKCLGREAEVALIDVGADIYQLAGKDVEWFIAENGGTFREISDAGTGLVWKPPMESDWRIDVVVNDEAKTAMFCSQDEVDCGRALGLVNFGEAYRIGGIIVTHFVENAGGYSVRSGHIASDGRFITGVPIGMGDGLNDIGAGCDGAMG
jgi:hypothetical protein